MKIKVQELKNQFQFRPQLKQSDRFLAKTGNASVRQWALESIQRFGKNKYSEFLTRQRKKSEWILDYEKEVLPYIVVSLQF